MKDHTDLYPPTLFLEIIDFLSHNSKRVVNSNSAGLWWINRVLSLYHYGLTILINIFENTTAIFLINLA